MCGKSIQVPVATPSARNEVRCQAPVGSPVAVAAMQM